MASGTFTIKSSGGNYTSLAGWLAGEGGDLTGTGPCIAECYALGVADTSVISLDVFITTAVDYVKIYCPAGERHSGVWETGKYYLEGSTSAAIIGRATTGNIHLRLDGLQIRNTYQTSGSCINFSGGSSGGDIWISNCIIRDGYRGISNSCEDNCYIWNCMVYGAAAEAVYTSRLCKVRSCVLIGTTYGIYKSGTSNMLAENCYAKGNTAAYYTTNVNTTTCASADATGSAGLQNIAYDNTTFVNTAAGAEDLHIIATSPLVGAGTNTSAFGAPMDFTTDIDGDDMGTSWPVGADQLSSTSSGLVSYMMVGAVTDTTAKVFLRTNEASYPVKIEYKKTTETWTQAVMTAEKTTSASMDYCVVFDLPSLAVLTSYDFRSYASGSVATTGGLLKTFPAPDTPAVTKFGVGSCLDSAGKPYSIFDQINTKTPDFFIMCGDQIYADYGGGVSDQATAWDKYSSGWGNTSLKTCFKTRSMFMIMDNHEFANVYPKSNATFADLWRWLAIAYYTYQQSHNHASPDDISGVCETGTATTNITDTGAFGDAEVGDVVYNATQQKITGITALVDASNITVADSGFFAVGDSYLIPRFYYSAKCGEMEFFYIDDMSYKTSPTMLGTRQKNWLKSAVVNSTATWKILVTGQNLVSSPSGGWAGLATERAEILDYFEAAGVTGFLSLSGDIHSSRAVRLKGVNASVPYVYPWVYEFVSSPLSSAASGGGNPTDGLFYMDGNQYYVIITSDTTQPDPELKVEFYAKGTTAMKVTCFVYHSKSNKNLGGGGGGGVNSAWGTIH